MNNIQKSFENKAQLGLRAPVVPPTGPTAAPATGAASAPPQYPVSPNPGTGARQGFTFGDNNAPGPKPAGGALQTVSPLRSVPFPDANAATDVDYKNVVPPEKSGAYKLGEKMRPFLKDVGPGGSKLAMAGNAATGALAFSPYVGALGDDSGMTTGQKAKMFADGLTRTAGGVLGGVAGAGVGGAIGSVAGPAGTLAGGLTGGAAGGYLGAKAFSEAGSDLRKGANWINGQLGGDPNYITPIADDMKKAGFNPNPDIMQRLGGNQRENDPNAAPPTLRAPVPTPVAPAVAPVAPAAQTPDQQRAAYVEGSNAKMGLSAQSQRSAIDVSGDNASAGAIGRANAMQNGMRGTDFQGMAPTYNLGTYGGDATIYGQSSAPGGGGKINSFTGTGTTQDDGGQRQREMTAQRVADMNRTGDLQRQVSGLRSAEADQGAMNFGSDSGVSKYAGVKTMNARTAQEANAISERNSIRTNDTARWTGERQLAQNMRQMQWDRSKFGTEREEKNRDFGLRSNEFAQKQANDTLAHRDSREKQVQSNLEAANTTTVDGKSVIDQNAVRVQRAGIDRAVARLGTDIHKLSPMDEQRLLAGSKLMARLQADGSNFNPFKPDFLKTIDPLDLTNMRKVKDGYQLTSPTGGGQVIPSRYFEKQGADRFMPGTPTNEYDILLGEQQ